MLTIAARAGIWIKKGMVPEWGGRERQREERTECRSYEISLILFSFHNLHWTPSAVTFLSPLFSFLEKNRGKKNNNSLYWVHRQYSLTKACLHTETSMIQRARHGPFYLSISVCRHTLMGVHTHTHSCPDLQWWVMGHSAHWYEAATWPKMTKTTILMLHHSYPCLIWGCANPIMSIHFFHLHRKDLWHIL